jgi:hypothetical protein
MLKMNDISPGSDKKQSTKINSTPNKGGDVYLVLTNTYSDDVV